MYSNNCWQKWQPLSNISRCLLSNTFKNTAWGDPGGVSTVWGNHFTFRLWLTLCKQKGFYSYLYWNWKHRWRQMENPRNQSWGCQLFKACQQSQQSPYLLCRLQSFFLVTNFLLFRRNSLWYVFSEVYLPSSDARSEMFQWDIYPTASTHQVMQKDIFLPWRVSEWVNGGFMSASKVIFRARTCSPHTFQSGDH